MTVKEESLAELADLLNDRCDALGLTNEVFTTRRYELCQAWASCFVQAGWDGLRVRLRHLLSQGRWGIAMFGPEGPQPDDARYTAEKLPIGDDEIALFKEETGIRVEPVPVEVSSLGLLS